MTTPAAPLPPIIEALHLSKSYGTGANRFHALDDVSLTIRRGESVAIVGRSGSGKSTLMHLLALLDTPDAGDLLVDGRNTRELSRRDINRLRNERLGFVFQQFFVTPGDSVLENVMLPLKIAGIAPSERRRRSLEVLERLGLDDKARSRAVDLSGGQKQRVVIARALANSPDVIFADEPTGNLDSTTGATVEDQLFALNRENGITLVIVTHDEQLAARCDRRLTIRDGRLETGRAAA